MDGGSSLNLLYQDTVRKMGIDHSVIKPTKATFRGVIPGVEASCTGSIALEVVFGSPDNYRTEELIFEIVPFHSDYQALLARTAFARFNAVPHYAYRKLKMPGPRGVITVNGKAELPPRYQRVYRCFNSRSNEQPLPAEPRVGDQDPGHRQGTPNYFVEG